MGSKICDYGIFFFWGGGVVSYLHDVSFWRRVGKFKCNMVELL